ncbi:class I SAM-dependent methyltransferase [Polynucleobacter paneuropaeus]|nr:class I SAM-dependent methyltransferase [Polynucleobacter paneuropaeus]
MSNEHERELKKRQRFAFGQNWNQYINDINEDRIFEAELSLRNYLRMENLSGYRFLDIGCGSGIFSLAAKRLGASVVSFDFDPKSVGCAQYLKDHYFPEDNEWQIIQGSILDDEFMNSLGLFDIVYSWGVLHHTGFMWKALENALIPLAANGILFISIYNDQGRKSNLWKIIKKGYVRSPTFLKKIYELFFLVGLWGPATLRDLVCLKPFSTWYGYKKHRGMSPYIDLVDWIGGYPFEVAGPDAIFQFFSARHLKLSQLKTCGGGHGCNEYVFLNNDRKV